MEVGALARQAVQRYRDEIIQVMQDLVHLSSQNTPPLGQEKPVQDYIAGYLQRAGLPVCQYELGDVPGLKEHPMYWPGREYRGRPNLSSTQAGLGGGRSLLLTGHCDTVPVGEGLWTRDPFGAEIHEGRMYGLGSLDMKGPLGAALVLYKAVAELGLPLKGSLSIESVVDEEFGGVNGTLAGRLHDGPVDGAVILESTGLEIYPASKGLLISHLVFHTAEIAGLRVTVAEGAVAAGAGPRAEVVEQISIVLSHLDGLNAQRRVQAAKVTPALYRADHDPVPAQVTKVYAGGWGSQVPITVPQEGRIELVVHMLPGETREAVLQQQRDWLDGVIAQHPQAFGTRPEIRFPLRWLMPTAMDVAHPLVTTLSDSVAQATGRPPVVIGGPYACDLFALHHAFGLPAVVFGPAGANPHAADEYVEMESIFHYWEALLHFVVQWCGLA